MKYIIPSALWYLESVRPLTDYFTGRFIDRTERLDHGFEAEVLRPLPTSMPNDPGDYAYCMKQRAIEIGKLSTQYDKPIALLWSGGWDSTSIASSFLKHNIPFKFVYADSSIMENPNFYNECLNHDDGIKVDHPLRWLHFDGPDYLVVTGECGAQMCGTISFRKILVEMNTDDHDIGGGVTEDFESFMKNPEPLYMWPDKFKKPVYHALDYWPGPPFKSNYDAMWCITFVFKWQSIQYRMEMFSGRIQPTIEHFFLCDIFEAWSMNNTAEVKCPDYKWANYKLPFKDYIYDYSGNKDVYTLNKYASMQLPQPEIRYGVYQNRYIYRDENGDMQVGV